MLRDWLIRKLGGVLASEYFACNKIIGDNNVRHASEIEWLRDQLEKERARNISLQSIIFEKFGIVTPHQEPEMRTEPLKPLQVTNENWARRKNRLERDDAKRAADAVEKHWRAKSVLSEDIEARSLETGERIILTGLKGSGI